MTVHKLQGAGRKLSLVLLIIHTTNFWTIACYIHYLHEQKRCLLLAEPNAFLQCIRTSHNHRNTWLKSQIENSYIGE